MDPVDALKAVLASSNAKFTETVEVGHTRWPLCLPAYLPPGRRRLCQRIAMNPGLWTTCESTAPPPFSCTPA